MSKLREFRTMSLEFRRVSSNLLNSDRGTADVAALRFYNYLKSTPWIWNLIFNVLQKTEYDFRDCFIKQRFDAKYICIPADEKEHLKAQFEYLESLVQNKSVSILNEALQYRRSSKTYDEIIREFLNDAFKPMIDYINDSISKEMILIEEEEKRSVPMVYQNIEHNYGTANAQGSGTINSMNLSSSLGKEIVDLLERIIPSLDGNDGIPQEEIEDIKDDLESVREQVEAEKPKKARLQKAANRIKKFLGDFASKVAVSVAAKRVTEMDWQQLIEKIDLFIERIPLS